MGAVVSGPAGATNSMRTASAIVTPLPESASCTTSVSPLIVKTPRSWKFTLPTVISPAGAKRWLNVTTESCEAPSRTVYGAFEARLEFAIQVVETR